MREESGVAAGQRLAALRRRRDRRRSAIASSPIWCAAAATMRCRSTARKVPNELRPPLALTYSTGAGNGPFGLGWRLNVCASSGAPIAACRATTRRHVRHRRCRELVPSEAAAIARASDSRFWLHRALGATAGASGPATAARSCSARPARAAKEAAAACFAWHLDEELDAAGNKRQLSLSARRQNGCTSIDPSGASSALEFIYESRADVLRNGRAGFLRTTALRLAAIELHCDGSAPTLLRTYALAYARPPERRVAADERSRWKRRGRRDRVFPPARASTTPPSTSPSGSVHELPALVPPRRSTTRDATRGHDRRRPAGRAASSAGGMLLWRNRGDGWLDGPSAIDGVPSTVRSRSRNVALADLDGNGRVDLFAVDQPLAARLRSQRPRRLRARPGGLPRPPVPAPRRGRHASDGPRRRRRHGADQTGPDGSCCSGTSPAWAGRTRSASRASPISTQFPDVSFRDRGVVLADMTGDGLQDFVSVKAARSATGRIVGHGASGAQVEMDEPPRLPARLSRRTLASCWISTATAAPTSSTSTTTARHLAQPVWRAVRARRSRFQSRRPRRHRVLAADFFGDGRPGFAWSASRGRATTARAIACSASTPGVRRTC